MEACAAKEITSYQKEATAIIVMRCMLIALSEDKGIPFEEAMLAYSTSRTYSALFDFDTQIWKESPDYLRGLYDEELNSET